MKETALKGASRPSYSSYSSNGERLRLRFRYARLRVNRDIERHPKFKGKGKYHPERREGS